MRLAENPPAASVSLPGRVRALVAGRSAEQVVYGLLILAAATHIAVFAATGVLRGIYPYPFDGLEPGALQELGRVLAGQPLYAAPNLDYVPQIYGPLYFYLAAPLAALSGSGQFALRVTSLLASLGSIALLTLLVRRETGSLGMGLVGGALLAGCDQLVDGTMDIGRTDATMLLFLMGAMYVTRRATLERSAGWRSAALGGCLMGLSLLTKQSGAPVAGALMVVLAIVRRRQLVAFGAGLGLTFGGGLMLLVAQSGHWPIYFLWELPRLHQILPQLVWRMWGDVVVRFAAPMLLAPLFLVACLLRGDRGRALFYSLVPLAMVGEAWATNATIRGARNVELPFYAACAMLAALSLHEGLSWIGRSSRLARTGRAYVLAAAIGQLVVLVYNPRLMVPYRSDKWAGDRLAARLATLPGPIFAGGYQGFLGTTPGAVAPDLEAVVELQGERQRPSTAEGDEWGGEMAGALATRRFTYLVVNPEADGFIVPELASDYGYKDAGPLFPSDDVYWQWRTGWAPKAELYVRPDSAP